MAVVTDQSPCPGELAGTAPTKMLLESGLQTPTASPRPSGSAVAAPASLTATLAPKSPEFVASTPRSQEWAVVASVPRPHEMVAAAGAQKSR